MKEKPLKAIAGSPEKLLHIGNVEVEAYVLENGIRVLSGRGMQEALGMGKGHGGKLKDFTSKKGIKGLMQAKLAMALENPVRFIRPGKGGKPALAIDATFLPKFCEVIIEAGKNGLLRNDQEQRILKQAEVLLGGMSKVGIIALVDEITGYQKVRKDDELQAILTKYVAPEFLPWAKRFPDIFYQELYRLKNIPFDPKRNKHSWVGHLTNRLVYDQLPKGVLEELRKKNPVNEKGYRSKKHHQFLTDDIGNPHLEKQLISVITLMRISPSWRIFERHFNRAFAEQQPLLEIPEEDEV